MLHGEKSQKRCAHALVRDVAGCYRQDATNRSRTPVVIHSISRVESLSMYHAQHKKGSTLSIFCTDSHERNSKNTKTRHYGTWQSTYENIGVEQWMRFIRPFLRAQEIGNILRIFANRETFVEPSHKLSAKRFMIHYKTYVNVSSSIHIRNTRVKNTRPQINNFLNRKTIQI